MSRLHCKPRRGRSAFALLAVLVVTMLTAMIITGMVYQVRAEQSASFAGVQSEQAWLAAMSGLEHAMQIASQAPADPEQWRDDPDRFADQLVMDDGVEQWRFTIFAPRADAPDEWRFGLTDQAGRLDLHALDRDALLALPGLTTTQVDSLLAFLAGEAIGDADDAQTPLDGALDEPRDDALSGGPQPTTPQPRRLATLDELLLVPGFDAEALYGREHFISRQMRRDRMNDDAMADGALDETFAGFTEPALRDLLTVHAYDPDLTNDRQPRIDLNGPMEAIEASELPEQTVRYLQAMRDAESRIALFEREGDPNDAGQSAYLNALRAAPKRLEHPADLLDATFPADHADGEVVMMESGIDETTLPMLLDGFTTRIGSQRTTLVNINTASAAVLMNVPGIDEPLAESIVATRQGLDAAALATPAWLYTEQLVDAEAFKAIAPHVTAQAFQFHVYVVGYGLPSGRYRMIEAVLDLGGDVPRVIYLRDLTRLSLPLAVGRADAGAMGMELAR